MGNTCNLSNASLVVYTPGIIESLNGPAHISSECDVFVVFLSGDEGDKKMLQAEAEKYMAL